MRIPNWQQGFNAWLASAQMRQFEWGQFDCALMAAECIEVLTGTHPEPDLPGSYHSPIGAARVLHEHDGLTGICDRHLKRIEVKDMDWGDIALGRFDNKETLMVSAGSDFLAMGERATLINKESAQADIAWRVE